MVPPKMECGVVGVSGQAVLQLVILEFKLKVVNVTYRLQNLEEEIA